MTATRILLVRHGAHTLQGKVMVGRAAGVALAEEGRRQAAFLGERLAARPIAAVVTSPLERARETARPIAERHDLTPRILDALNEIDFGDWTGLSLDELAPLPLWTRWHTRRSTTRIPGGELIIEAQQRGVAAMLDLCDRYPGATVVAVSHGDVIRGILAYALGLPLDLLHRIEISPGSLSILRFAADGAVVEAMNEGSHSPLAGAL